MATRSKSTNGAAKSKPPIPLPASSRPFQSLSDAEREAVWESFNVPAARGSGKRPTASERRQFESLRARGKVAEAKRKPGRPTIGLGTKSVLISIEQGLLADADAYAKKYGLKRTQLVAHALRLVMAGPPPTVN